MACDYALCSMFVPGDRQVIVGTKVRGSARPEPEDRSKTSKMLTHTFHCNSIGCALELLLISKNVNLKYNFIKKIDMDKETQ